MSNTLRSLTRLGKLGFAIARSKREARKKPPTTPQERARWQQRTAQRMLAALEIQVSVKGEMPQMGMIVCNHLGYLDVIAIAAQGPAVFVSKSEVRRWPVIGSLLESSCTILAERERPMTSGKTAYQIEQALAAGLPVVLFPEGTSSDGSAVLPFKPTLLQAALNASAPVTAAAISYLAPICYWGDASFPTHLFRIAGIRKIRLHLRFAKAGSLPESRKAAAQFLHREVLALLEFRKHTEATDFHQSFQYWPETHRVRSEG